MLSFILSKMNMMIFATGVFIVAVIFMSFLSGNNESREAFSLLQSKAQIIEEQLSTDSLCSLKVQSIPDTLRTGLSSDYLFYEMQFTRKNIGDEKKVLELSISERNKDNLIASKSVYTTAEIIFIDPEYFQEDDPVDNYFNDGSSGKESITLYPRGDFSPNSYVVLKQVTGGQTKLFIIPCTSTTPGSCTEGITKTGCYLMKQMEKEPGVNFRDDDLVPSCFNVSLELSTDEGEVVTKITKKQCKELINENYFN